MKKFFVAAIFAALTATTATAQQRTTANEKPRTEQAQGKHIDLPTANRAPRDPRKNAEKTEYTTTIQGKEVQIWRTLPNRRAFVILISKKGTEYRKYLGEEMTQRVNK